MKVVRWKPALASFLMKTGVSGRGSFLSWADGPLVAELGGVGAKTDYGEGQAEAALEGVDAVADLGRVSWCVLPYL